MTKEIIDKAIIDITDDLGLKLQYSIYGKLFNNCEVCYFGADSHILMIDKMSASSIMTALIELDSIIELLENNNITYTVRPLIDGNLYLIIIHYNYFVISYIRNIESSKYITTFKIYSDDDSFEFINTILTNDKINFANSNKKITYYYVVFGQFGFLNNPFELSSNYNINLNENFNDSLPLNEFDKFITKEECGLSLLHGIPGCGKTTFIKNLIYRYGEKYKFYILDASLLSNISDGKFITFLMDNRKGIFIIEDCEKLLLDRKTHDNPWIGTLLNLTDGMLGDSLGIKFICTFNCDLESIDKALLREGRLDILYEFKPLSLEKSKHLCEKLEKTCDKEMTLAEIYKTKSDNSKLTNKRSKIGF